MKTIYLDISSYCTGYLICDFPKNKQAQVLQINKIQVPWNQKNYCLSQRIMFLYKNVLKLFKTYNEIKRVCWEDQFVNKNARVGMELSQIRGSLIPLFYYYKADIMEPAINNKTVKKYITGNGNCKKEELFDPTKEIIRNNIKYFPSDICNLLVQSFCEGKSKKDYYQKNDDIFDAIGLFIYDCQLLQ